LARIGVVLAEMSELLCEIVRTTAAAPDVEFVDGCATREQAVQLVRNGEARVVVIGRANEPLPAAYRELLYERPRARVIAMHDAGGEASMYGLEMYQQRLGNIAISEFLDAIRQES
jgi:hypothetical protein